MNGTVVTDFETLLVDSLRTSHPEASLHGCFFHFCQEDMELRNIFAGLYKYVRRQWIGLVTPQHFNVYNPHHRTNNVMEYYHRCLNSKLVIHPGLWDLNAERMERDRTSRWRRTSTS